MLRDRLGVSERRACQIAGQHRSTQRHESNAGDDDAGLRARLGRRAGRATFDHLSLDALAFQRAVGERRGDRGPGLGGACLRPRGRPQGPVAEGS